MAKKLKFQTGQKVLYKSNVGGFGPKPVYTSIILLALKKKGCYPYILEVTNGKKKWITYSLERDLKLAPITETEDDQFLQDFPNAIYLKGEDFNAIKSDYLKFKIKITH